MELDPKEIQGSFIHTRQGPEHDTFGLSVQENVQEYIRFELSLSAPSNALNAPWMFWTWRRKDHRSCVFTLPKNNLPDLWNTSILHSKIHFCLTIWKRKNFFPFSISFHVCNLVFMLTLSLVWDQVCISKETLLKKYITCQPLNTSIGLCKFLDFSPYS